MKTVLIIPVYNEEDALMTHFEEIDSILKKDGINVNYMFVDDGSKDKTWSVINDIAHKCDRVSAIRFARNFGKEFAMAAGVDNVLADRYIIMDSDLQHPPTYIKDMMKIMDEQGVNLVEGVKDDRGEESAIYKLTAKSFYKFLEKTTGLDMNKSSDFRVFDDEVASSIRQFKEKHLFFRGVVDWVGFNRVEFPFHVEERQAGNSGFNLYKLMKLAMDAIFSHTSKPLLLTMFNGLLFVILAIILGAQTLVNYFSGEALTGFSTVILLLLITGAMIMLSLGIIGIYLGRIYDEVKARPRYLLSHKLNCDLVNKEKTEI